MASKDIKTSLYNNKYEIEFVNSNHSYKVNGETKEGVTTSMGKILAKPGLALWPMNTALQFIFNNHYSYSRDGFTLQDLLQDASEEHKKIAKSGAYTGSRVHELAEMLLGKQLVNIQLFEESPEISQAITALQKWIDEVNPMTIELENIVYSKKLDYIGTFDSILEIDGKTYLCDLKTTKASKEAPKGVYAENFVQLGAYAYAYNEQRDYELKHGGSNLVEIHDLMIISAKKNGKLDIVKASDIGLTIKDCTNMWVDVHNLAKAMNKIKENLKR